MRAFWVVCILAGGVWAGPKGPATFTIDNQSSKPICRILARPAAHPQGGELTPVFDAKSPADCIAPKTKKAVSLGTPGPISGCWRTIEVAVHETIGGTGTYEKVMNTLYASPQPMFEGGVGYVRYCESHAEHPVVVKDYEAGTGSEVAACCDHTDEDQHLLTIATVESQARSLAETRKGANNAEKQCFGELKEPIGAADKKAKLSGKWSCMLSGVVSGNSTMIITPGDHGKLDVAEERFVKGQGSKTIDYQIEQRGSSVWEKTDQSTLRGELVTGVLKIRQKEFVSGQCYELKATCTRSR